MSISEGNEDIELIRRRSLSRGLIPGAFGAGEGALFLKGYQLLSEEMNEKSIEGRFQAAGDLQAVEVQKYSLDEELLRKIAVELDRLKGKKTLGIDRMLGYDDDILLNCYEIGSRYYLRGEVAKSIPICTFLVNLAPDVSPFWLALALSLEKNQQFVAAIDACPFAVEREGGDFTPFVVIVRCSEEIQDFSKAVALLNEYKDVACFKNEIEGALEYIQMKQR